MKSTKLALWVAAFAAFWATSVPCLALHPSRTESSRKSALRVGRLEFSLRGGGDGGSDSDRDGVGVGSGGSGQGSSGQGATNASGDYSEFAPGAQFAAAHAAESMDTMCRFSADTTNTNTNTTTISNSDEAGSPKNGEGRNADGEGKDSKEIAPTEQEVYCDQGGAAEAEEGFPLHQQALQVTTSAKTCQNPPHPKSHQHETPIFLRPEEISLMLPHNQARGVQNLAVVRWKGRQGQVLRGALAAR